MPTFQCRFFARRGLPLFLIVATACLAISVTPVRGQAGKDVKIEVLVEKYEETGKQMERREVYRDAKGKAINHGKYTFWFPNGNKSYEVTYVDDKRDGKQINYHFTGSKSSEQFFDKGKQVGKEPWWDESGVMYREFEYAEDTPDGTWTWWYPAKEGAKPQKVCEQHWKQGAKEGLWTWWYENGQKGVEGQYHDHKQHGEWKYWDKDGKLTETREYHAGELAKPAK